MSWKPPLSPSRTSPSTGPPSYPRPVREGRMVKGGEEFDRWLSVASRVSVWVVSLLLWYIYDLSSMCFVSLPFLSYSFPSSRCQGQSSWRCVSCVPPVGLRSLRTATWLSVVCILYSPISIQDKCLICKSGGFLHALLHGNNQCIHRVTMNSTYTPSPWSSTRSLTLCPSLSVQAR